MKQGQRLWTRDELILAINLYCKLSFGRLHRLNPEVINLSNLINRTPSSVAFNAAPQATFPKPERQTVAFYSCGKRRHKIPAGRTTLGLGSHPRQPRPCSRCAARGRCR